MAKSEPRDTERHPASAAEDGARRPHRRGLRVALRVVGGLVGFILLALMGALLVLQTDWGSERARRLAVARLNGLFDGAELQIGRLDGNFIGHLALYDVNLIRSDDRERLVHVDTVTAGYRLLALLQNRLHLTDVYLARPAVRAAQRADSLWDLATVIARDSAAVDTAKAPLVIELDRLRVRDGRVRAAFFAPGRDSVLFAEALNLDLGSVRLDDPVTVRVDTAHVRITLPGERMDPLRFALGGEVADGRFTLRGLRLASSRSDVTGRGTLALPSEENDNGRALDFTLTASPLAFADLRPFLPALAQDGTVDLDVRVRGGDVIRADAEAAFSDGARLTLAAEGTPPGEGPARYRATGRLTDFNPAFVTGDPAQDGRVDAELDVDLSGPAPERVSGRANLTLTDTRVGAYTLAATTLRSTFTDGEGSIDLDTGLRGAVLAVDGTVRPFDPVPRYDLAGRIERVDLGRLTDDPTQHSDVNARFTLVGQGLQPDSADVRATLDLAPSRINAYHLSDGRLAAHLRGGALDFDARVTIPEGAITARGDAAFGEEIRFAVEQGRFDGLDVAALTGDTTYSRLDGTFALRGRLRRDGGTDPAAMTLAARLDLAPSVYGPYTVDDANVRANLGGGRLQLDGDADLGAVGTLTLAAAGRPFDPVPTFDVRRLDFRRLDLGALTADTTQTSDLNGTLALRTRGTDPRTMTLTARLDLAPSRLNAQAIDGADVTADLRAGDLAFEGRLALPEGQAALIGTLRPLDEMPTYAVREGAFAGLDVGALAGNPGLETDLNGRFTLHGTGLDPETMTIEASLVLAPSAVNRVTGLAGDVRGGWDAGQGDVRADLAFDGGRAALVAAGDVRGDEPTYQARGVVEELDLAGLAGQDAASARLSAGFDVEGAGVDPATMTLAGQLYARRGVYGDVRLDTLGADVRLAEGMLRVDSLLLRSNVATASAGGTLALFDSTNSHVSDFRFAADVVTAAPIRGLIQAEVFALQEGHVEGTVHGPADALRLDVSAAANSLVYNDLRLAGLDARAAGTLGPDRAPTLGEASVALNYLSTPTLTVRMTTLDAAYDGDVLAFNLEAGVDERRDVALTARLDPRPEHRRLLLENLTLRLDEDRWTLQDSASIAYGDRYLVEGFRLASGDQQIVAEGIIDPQGTQDFHLTVAAFRIGAVADLLGFDALDGTLSTRVDLTGPADAPLLDGRLDLTVVSDDADVGELGLDLGYADRRLNLDALLTHASGSALAAEGYLPLDLRIAPADTGAIDVAAADGAANLRVTSDAFAIDWMQPFLDPETVDALEGDLSTDITITGSMSAPELAGTVGFTGGRVGLPQLGVTYADIEAAARLEGGRVVLERAAVRSGDGTLVAEGTIEVPELTLGTYDLTARLDDFRAVDSDAYRTTVSGALTLRGTTDAPAIGGRLQVLNADVYLDGLAGGDVRQVALTEEDVRMLETYFGYRPSARDTTVSDLFDALALDLTVELERDTWIRQTTNPELAIQLTGDLGLNKAPGGEIQLFRSIEVIPTRSYLRQFGRRFDVTRGTITFNGPIPELIMAVGAQYEVRSRTNPGQPEATITLELSGRLDDLTLELGSDPPMDNANIVSYIATGRPASEAFQFGGGGGGGNGGLLAQGGGLAANELAGIVENLAGEELGLDVIEIQQDGLRGTQLVAGKYVGPRIYVGVSQPVAFTSTADTRSGAASTEVTLEYEAFEWLLLRLLSGTSTNAVRINLMGKYAFD